MQSEQFQLHAEIELRHWWFVGRRRIMRRLVNDVLPPSKDASVVDVGCGTGANLAALVEDYTCVGIDTSSEAIDAARQRFPNVRFLRGHAPEDLGEVLDSARLFLLMDVLEHVEDDFAMFSKLLAATPVGCHFLITVPANEALWSEHDESFGHFRRYSRQRFERIWDGLPVKCRLISHFSSRMYPVIRLIRSLNRLRHGTSGQAGTDFWLPSQPVNRLLEATFAGEAGRLSGLLHGRRRHGYAFGTSLVAVLERQSGEVSLRKKPNDLSVDHCPASLEFSQNSKK